MGNYYLAYGSNLSLEQMKFRCKDSEVVGTTVLENYRLVYKGMKDAYSYLTIEKCEGSIVPVGIYKISYFDEVNLNKYEGYLSSYSKEYIPINLNGKMVKGMIYVMNNKFDYHIPTDRYIEICMEGYKDFGFDVSILEKALEVTKENMEKVYRK